MCITQHCAASLRPLRRPQRERLRFGARGGCEALQLPAAAGVGTGAGSYHPGRAADLLGPAAPPWRGLLPASEADQLHARPVHCRTPPLLAASHLHELHLPARGCRAQVPAIPPQEVRCTQATVQCRRVDTVNFNDFKCATGISLNWIWNSLNCTKNKVSFFCFTVIIIQYLDINT